MQRHIIASLGIVGFLLTCLVFVAVVALRLSSRDSPRDIPEFHLDVKGIVDPEFAKAAEAAIDDGDIVIGVAGFDVPRAYVQKALQFVPPRHVVTKVTKNGSIAVTRCERSDCTRVFIDRDPNHKLDIRIGGWSERQLELIVDDQRFTQSSKEIPLEEVSYVQTTWGEWRAQFPDTLVYTGPTTVQDRHRIAQWELERAKLGLAPDQIW